MVEHSRELSYFSAIERAYLNSVGVHPSWWSSMFVQCALSFKDIDANELNVILDLEDFSWVNDQMMICSLEASAKALVKYEIYGISYECCKRDYLDPIAELESKLRNRIAKHVS